MKKTILAISVLTVTAAALKGQGLINANNINSGVFITLADGSGIINGGAVSTIGTPAAAAGFTGAGPGQVSLTLYAALNGTSFFSLTQPQNIIATGFNSTSLMPNVQGTENFGSNLALPTKPGFDGSQPLEFVFFGIDATGEFQGFSREGTITPTTAPNTPAPIFGTAPGQINSFILTTPEPSIFAMVGLGSAALALLRRHKKN